MEDVNKQKAILEIKNLWRRKKMKIPLDEFIKWYLSQDKKCFYCGITEEEIKNLLDNGKLITKRIKTRGRKLELDRKAPNLSYDNIDNLVFSCYWCNNAKTDEFTTNEFKEVGKVFKKIWEKRKKE
jgi:5-methylcytosine-specific restriction endonuclease McrA